MELEMIESAQTELTMAGLDPVNEAYIAWLCAESECERALRAWFDGDPMAYVAYTAALEREEAAACDLQRSPRSRHASRVPGANEVSR
jgi:hypothetical protein